MTPDDAGPAHGHAEDQREILQRLTHAPFKPKANRDDGVVFAGFATTERCELSCVMCHFNGPNATKKAATLSPELVEKGLRQLQPGFAVWFAATGDFFMDPNALTYLRKTSELGLNPCVLTHGQSLTPALMDAILDVGVRTLRLSVDAIDPHQYAKIRRGGSLDKILAACAYLRDKKETIADLRVDINCLLFKNTKEKQKEIEDFWRGKVDAVYFHAEYYDTFRFRNMFFTPKERVDCKMQLYVLPSGYITPCCAMMVYAHDHDVSWLPHIASDTLEEAQAKLCDLYEDPHSKLGKICANCDWWILWAKDEQGHTPYLRPVELDPK
jgi:MoaA/NifB/PqqE/SkfB family radical SAM enzyme